MGVLVRVFVRCLEGRYQGVRVVDAFYLTISLALEALMSLLPAIAHSRQGDKKREE